MPETPLFFAGSWPAAVSFSMPYCASPTSSGRVRKKSTAGTRISTAEMPASTKNADW